MPIGLKKIDDPDYQSQDQDNQDPSALSPPKTKPGTVLFPPNLVQILPFREMGGGVPRVIDLVLEHKIL